MGSRTPQRRGLPPITAGLRGGTGSSDRAGRAGRGLLGSFGLRFSALARRRHSTIANTADTNASNAHQSACLNVVSRI